jgi:hypothetical protein
MNLGHVSLLKAVLISSRDRGGVPDLARAVVAGRDDERAVPVEAHRRDGHGVGTNRVEAPPSLQLPY